MSDFRAIGGVSATLQALLYDRMERPDGVPDVVVTVGPPRFGPRDNEPAREDPRVNLFLYRVTENGYLQNQEIPGHGSPGGYGHPPLSVNLHFLLTAYGNRNLPQAAGQPPLFDDTLAHFLLGSAMRVLHDVPVVTEALATVRPPSGLPVLHASLRGEFEQVKATLEPLTLEDVTKVWSALTLRYRLSAPYVVTVVQIESRRTRRLPRPVGEPPSRIAPLPGDPPVPGPNVDVFTIRVPSIGELLVLRAGETRERTFAYARIGDTLVVRGSNLAGGLARVRLGELDIPVATGSNDRLEVRIPDNAIPGVGVIAAEQQLEPGVIAVSVALAPLQNPPRVMRSNESVFMLVPTVTALAYAAAPVRSLRIDGARLVSLAAGGEVIIGRSVIPRAAYTAATPLRITVNLPDTLPMRGVSTLVSQPLADPVLMGPNAQSLDIDIGGVARTVTPTLPASIPRDALPALLQAVIRDARPADPTFAGARVTLSANRLVIVPGGLTGAVTISSQAPSTAAADLGLTGPAAAGAAHATLSGELDPFPMLTAPRARVGIRIGAQGPFALTFDRPTFLGDAAAKLEAQIRAAAANVSFAQTRVTTLGHQLLVIPGTADDVIFEAVPDDDRSVVELQLHARYAVRVRVNGAESFDDTLLELPQ